MNQCTSGPSNNHTVGCRKVVVNRLLANNAKVQRQSYLPSDQMEIGCEGSINIQQPLKDFRTLCWSSRSFEPWYEKEI